MTSDDAAGCAAVYRPYVTGSIATFEVEPPDTAAMAQRIAAAAERHAWLVGEDAGEVAGFAYGSTFRARPGWDWTCESTIYLRQGLRRTGAGRLLLNELLTRLANRGLRRAVAVVAQPNAASSGLHEALGYRLVGRWERVGWKLGAWHDVAWYERDLQAVEQDPPLPLR